jgi:predicted outer membrane repeat protein
VNNPHPHSPDVVFKNCKGLQGGAVYCLYCSITCDRCAFASNTASDKGGAFFGSLLDAAVFRDSSFEGNSAGDGGGALYIERPNDSGAVFERCLLLSNTAGSSGGGLLCDDCSSFQATNTIFALNAARGGTGGGARIVWTSSWRPVAMLRVVGTTFVDNTAAAGGGGASGLSIDAPGANLPLTVANSIFSGSSPLIQWQSPTDLEVSYSVWPDQPVPCSVCGSGIITLDPLLVRGAAALPAGTVGPAAWWAPTFASPGNKMGEMNQYVGIRDYLGNKRVSERLMLASGEHVAAC